jgi:hypothetical protein
MGKFSKYLDFLSKANESKKTEIELLNREIEINQKIISLLTKRANSQRVGEKEYEELAKYSCPDITIPGIFQLEIDEFNDLLISQDLYGTSNCNFLSSGDEYSNCHNTNCRTCWKNYINRTIEIINDSPYKIKGIVKE